MKIMLALTSKRESSITSNLGEKYVTSLRKRNKFFYTMQGEDKQNGNDTDAQQKAKHTKTRKPQWDCNYHCNACL